MKQTIIEGLGTTKPATKPRKATKTNTNELTTAVCKLINMKGGLAWRSNNGGTFSKARNAYIKGNGTNGAPDINACINGLCYGIEIKSKNDKLSDAQLNFKANLERAGGVYIECRNIEQIQALFK